MCTRIYLKFRYNIIYIRKITLLLKPQLISDQAFSERVKFVDSATLREGTTEHSLAN